jgi:hypothetical protein
MKCFLVETPSAGYAHILWWQVITQFWMWQFRDGWQ